jgi:nucleotide-binding universal stress UspA family protein
VKFPRPITVGEEEIRATRSQAIDMLPDGVEADVIVEVGLPDQVIVNVARRQEASMIVLGLHPHTSAFVAEHLPWTTAHRVVCDAHCPVMTVR